MNLTRTGFLHSTKAALLDRTPELMSAQEDTDSHGGGCGYHEKRNWRISQCVTAQRSGGCSDGTDHNRHHQGPPASNACAKTKRESEDQAIVMLRLQARCPPVTTAFAQPVHEPVSSCSNVADPVDLLIASEPQEAAWLVESVRRSRLVSKSAIPVAIKPPMRPTRITFAMRTSAACSMT